MCDFLDKLDWYYESEHKNKIFLKRLCVEEKSFDILYDYDKKEEIDKFVNSFTEYLPYYVWNADTLECLDLNGNISEALASASKRCWNNPIVPSRDTRVNGIYGEVFLDFYERIVNKAKLASTYASRRDFRSNYENKGFDNVLFCINDGEIEFVFSEAKFVGSKSAAADALVKDIIGEPARGEHKEVIGHLTSGFFNDYIAFVVQKNAFFSDDDKAVLKPFFKKLNSVLVEKDGNFIKYLIDENIKINCVFFAIFGCHSTEPKDFLDAYNKIEQAANENLQNMGFTNYAIEIVFIPTQANSMNIKGAIDEYYN